MKKYLPWIIVGVIALIIVVFMVLKKKRPAGSSSADLIREQTQMCLNNNKAQQAIANGYYVPDTAWARFGFTPSETCELLGWMQEIHSAKTSGRQEWPGTDTMEGMAEAAAYQLADDRGRL